VTRLPLAARALLLEPPRHHHGAERHTIPGGTVVSERGAGCVSALRSHRLSPLLLPVGLLVPAISISTLVPLFILSAIATRLAARPGSRRACASRSGARQP
jgi:hypothetical protein